MADTTTTVMRKLSIANQAQLGRPRLLQEPTPVRHFNQHDLARRWRVSPRTLERWRWLKQGPAYLKVGNHVVYRIEDVEAYEFAQRRATEAA